MATVTIETKTKIKGNSNKEMEGSRNIRDFDNAKHREVRIGSLRHYSYMSIVPFLNKAKNTTG
jgi:hypothetical protein